MQIRRWLDWCVRLVVITVRKAADRRHEPRRKYDVWMTFGANERGFGALEQLDEERLTPGAGAARRSDRQREIVTYVHAGTLAHEDSTGHSAVIHAGEFERTTAGTGIRHSETNASRTILAHVFHISVRSSEKAVEPSHEQRRFCTADRRGLLCVIASPDARGSSLRLRQDAIVYSALLARGQHVVHALAPGRVAWLHVVSGELMLDGILLIAGDGAGFSAERAASVTAGESAELLLVDVSEESAA